MIAKGTKPVKKSPKASRKIKEDEELKKTWEHKFMI